MKPIEQMTFDELADLAVQQVFFGLLEDGGKGFKSSLRHWMSQAIYWQQAQDSLKKVTKKNVKRS